MIVDENGNELLYWPTGALAAGVDSPAIVIGVDAYPGAYLQSNADVSAKVMARIHGSGAAFVDLAVAPIAFGSMMGRINFDIFIRPASPLAGVTRVPFFVGALSATPAAWTA